MAFGPLVTRMYQETIDWHQTLNDAHIEVSQVWAGIKPSPAEIKENPRNQNKTIVPQQSCMECAVSGSS